MCVGVTTCSMRVTEGAMMMMQFPVACMMGMDGSVLMHMVPCRHIMLMLLIAVDMGMLFPAVVMVRDR